VILGQLLLQPRHQLGTFLAPITRPILGPGKAVETTEQVDGQRTHGWPPSLVVPGYRMTPRHFKTLLPNQTGSDL
jgi:hypothetical protein